MNMRLVNKQWMSLADKLCTFEVNLHKDRHFDLHRHLQLSNIFISDITQTDLVLPVLSNTKRVKSITVCGRYAPRNLTNILSDLPALKTLLFYHLPHADISFLNAKDTPFLKKSLQNLQILKLFCIDFSYRNSFRSCGIPFLDIPFKGLQNFELVLGGMCEGFDNSEKLVKRMIICDTFIAILMILYFWIAANATDDFPIQIPNGKLENT